MKKETTLCMGCMAENKDNYESCAVCGYTGSGAFLSSYLPPTTFLAERYIIGKLISYNGEGALYVAFDTVNNLKVTIREYMPDTLCGRKKDEEAIEVNPQYVALYKTYLSEFIELNNSLMKSGQPLRVQRVLNVFSENNTAYAVYEYITGISLKSYLSNLGGVLPWEQVKEFFTPLFTTLNLIHTDGIIHRGISPSTILLNDKSELILINFGITASRTYASEINYEVFAGYTAPEQYSGAARHGSWTDVYGVAAVLYKVLTGQMPPNAVARGEEDNLTEPMLINRTIPPSVSAAIVKGLEIDTGTRTKTIGEFINQLFEAVPFSVPDSTHEILIKKPARSAEAEQDYVSRSRSGYGGKDKKKGTSNAAAVTVCVMLGLVLVVFVVMMIYGDRIYESMSGSGNGGNSTAAPIVNTTGNQSPVNNNNNNDTEINTETENNQEREQPQNTHLNERLYVVSDFTSRNFERTQDSNAFSFLIFIPEHEFNDEFPVGAIFEQSIAARSEVASGTEITVKVSKGPEFVPLPDYTGMTFEEFGSMLFTIGIKYDFTPEYNDDIDVNHVIRCSVNIGDIINRGEGDTVTIYYSMGADVTIDNEQLTIDNGQLIIGDEQLTISEIDELDDYNEYDE
jgi:serine/threonine-protein kinase